MSTASLTSYDEVPYRSNPIAASHPDRLATVATLLGMQPPALDRCRVLELGCASGGNLLPLALTLPEARFVGIDLSRRQIDDGLQTVAALGVTNLELRHASILDVDESWGTFEYVLCHGVYSWVPPAVQDKILDVCAQRLAPQGVAFISYNTYPGWHMQRMIREVMGYHARRFTEPHERVGQARALLDFLAQSAPRENSPYGMLLQQQVEFLRGRSDSYLFHEHLEEVNDPVYFYQFAERAAAKGLQYLGEADLHTMAVGGFPPHVADVLRRLSPDVIHLQQYLDFLRNTQFRQSLLCRQDVRLDAARRPEVLRTFQVASPVKPVSPQPDMRSQAPEDFRGPHGSMTTTTPLVKAAMVLLGETWPQAVPFERLLTAACERSGTAPGAESGAALASSLLNGYLSTNLIELHVWTPRSVVEPGARPMAFVLARHQAAKGGWVTNLRHEVIELNELDRHVVRLLDGSREGGAVLDALVDEVRQGTLQGLHNGRPLREADNLRGLLDEALRQSLVKLARSALLAE